MTMRLWIDGQCLQTTSRLRGIGRYVSELIRAIGEYCPDVEMSISFNAAMTDAAIAGRASVAPWIAPHNIHVWQGIVQGGECGDGLTAKYRLSEIALAHHMACIAPDIALSASPFEGQYDPATPLLTGAGHAIPRAAIFYDVIPHRYPSRYLKKGKDVACYKRRIAAHRNFDLLLAISDFARREANDILPGVKVAAIDAGVSPDFLALSRQAVDSAILARLGIRKPYLLYVGGIDWRKNLAGVRDAWTLLPQSLRDQLQFVMAGDFPHAWFEKFRSSWREAQLPDANLLGLGHVSDENLVQLYKQADLVIQPSLMEGFGLTALEAMSCGAPVIASNAGALPEVVGDESALFDPKDSAMMADRIASFLSDPERTRARIEQGQRQAAKFSWERTARLAVDALKAAARPATPQSRDAIRRITAAQLKETGKRAFAAQILAAAEPRPRTQGRLLIEVSQTAKRNPGTGVQRVVNGIAAALTARAPHQHQLEPQLCFCDSVDGFFPARFDSNGKLALTEKTPARKLLFGPADHLVMLDSSWTLSDILVPVIRRARLQGTEVISVLYDLTPAKLPGFCSTSLSNVFADWLKSALLYSSAFLCISQAVADELLALLEAIDFPRTIKVGYWRLGAAELPRAPAVRASVSMSAPMFLIVSTLEPHKGYRVALDAFTTLWREGFEGSLCLIGRAGWHSEHLVQDLKAHPEWGTRLQWLNAADDATLEAHYAACTALIAPSYTEGFGLPIVEAANHGKPVIASDIPVFREVAGDSAGVTYFTRGSAEALAGAVRDFLARHDAAPVVRPGKPVRWDQSAAALESIIANDKWYRIYHPRHPGSDIRLDRIGALTPPAPVTEQARRHRLTLVEGPIRINRGTRLKFVVSVTNLSETHWHSGGADGVRLRIRSIAAKGFARTRYARIPLVHIAGDTHYMAADIPARGARAVEIGLVQGEDWWAAPLHVSLR